MLQNNIVEGDIVHVVLATERCEGMKLLSYRDDESWEDADVIHGMLRLYFGALMWPRTASLCEIYPSV